ncbi:MAG: hypothetical protein ACKVOQ_07635 [Cyclobacteriaceae bacterium]
MMNAEQSILTNTQLEMLKLFSTNLSEIELRELKEVIAGFYAQKSIDLANQAWQEKKLTQTDMENWLNDPAQ